MTDNQPGAITVRLALVNGNTYNVQVVRTLPLFEQITQQLKGTVDENVYRIIFDDQRLENVDTCIGLNVDAGDVFDVMGH
jgi:hypothetical protein